MKAGWISFPVIALLHLFAGGFLSQKVYGYEAYRKDRPNVILIISDDQGWGDAGFNGCKDIPTPNLDALAASGVVFSRGYVTHPYCSPSRAGLLTGRYQQRFGHENNTPYAEPGPEDGLPLTEVLLSELLHRNGYRTCVIGKWHLGDPEKFWPVNRGFDDWFGFSGGSRSYWGKTGNNSAAQEVLRNGKPVNLDELSYLTDDFTREAMNYISRYLSDGKQPFFLYLAYNAPHQPLQASTEYLDRVSYIEDGTRAVYAAMVTGMDEGIGRIVNQLKAAGAFENTIIFFLSDNGGHPAGASNYPYRGHKGMLFEGGIRVPFLVSWPAMIQGGRTYVEAVSSLDIFPTVLEAVGIDHPPENEPDGTSLLSYLTGNGSARPHEDLFWRYSDGAGYAVLHGNFKLVRSAYKGRSLLFDIEKDPLEHRDLSKENPDVLKELEDLYLQWVKDKVPSRWSDPHLENVRKEEMKRKEIIDRARSGERQRL